LWHGKDATSIQPSKKRPHMENITIAPEERESLITEMKRERKPSRRLRMHIALLASDSLSPTEIARVLFCSRTTVYAVASRFNGEGRAAFDDRRARGPRPLLGEAANERLQKLIEEDSPMDHGWLRSRWSCKLIALQLFGERLAEAGRETLRRALHRLEYRWRRPRPVGPDKDSLEQTAEKRERLEDVRRMTEEEVASFFQDETKLETNPKVGFCWMRKGRQRRLKTPGTNRKVWISGALSFATGRLHWVCGERRNDELFVRLLEKLRRTYRCHKELHLATDNDASHTSKRVKEYVEDSGGRVRLHPLPSWSPESNPVELVWWSLHEAVSRNHQCEGLDDVVEFAEGYLKERQPFRLKLGEVYERLERAPP
jgi:putative transposase